MSDEIDQANDRALADTAKAVAAARVAISLPATGQCYNCNEDVGLGLRFCDVCCRDDWEKRTCRD